ncbi:Hypothetical predicted protein [Pelobates cultripes]|uniref:Uncharacterized protein n=1 Tax=Pelobates cultripes TaxID=61616 RepID=A0AAD1SXX3_PELCU|nr:Hypothetical predicted protein [Pelobates cultripes]CAH2325124.1 Hypothetical predicted protein [Pelobates cultripes]
MSTQDTHTVVEEAVDPEIGSFGSPEGSTKLRELRPTREESGVDGRRPASLPNCHTGFSRGLPVPFPPLWAGGVIPAPLQKAQDEWRLSGTRPPRPTLQDGGNGKLCTIMPSTATTDRKASPARHAGYSMETLHAATSQLRLTTSEEGWSRQIQRGSSCNTHGTQAPCRPNEESTYREPCSAHA